jgi:hypothetical protein
MQRTPMNRRSATPRCRQCRERFTPARPGQVIHEGCAEAWALSQIAKRNAKAAKADRAVTRGKLEKMKRLPELKADAQKAFNEFIRLRDAGKPCICCGRTKTAVDGLGSHGWDAGHYRSVGSAPGLRYDESNCHRQLVYCNRHGAGRAVDYRIGLIARIGLAGVERLEADNTVKKWTREELLAIRDEYRAKVRELKKGTACNP